jgi:hypothetical protein
MLSHCNLYIRFVSYQPLLRAKSNSRVYDGKLYVTSLVIELIKKALAFK